MNSPLHPYEPEGSLPRPESPYAPGDLVAEKYRLEEEIGEGGMGTVWIATNTTLETPVAIKILRWAGIVGASERMLREARAAAPLRHPAIVRVFDFGVAPGGHAYIVMELLEGESLSSLLTREGALSPERAVQLLLPVAEGLAVAHAHGVVHRDLKPENIFLAQDDSGRVQPKIVDFGIAKLIRPSSAPDLTGVTIIGTPQYMSPEQALGDDVDSRADVWALSVVLHELVTNEYVFGGGTLENVMSAVVLAPAASLVDKAGVDSVLWRIVERGLRKDRDERWPSTLEMGRALAAWLLERGVEEDVTGASIRLNWLELPATARSKRNNTTPPGVEVDAPTPQEDRRSLADTLALPAGSALQRSLGALVRLMRGRSARMSAFFAVAAAPALFWAMFRTGTAATPGEVVSRGVRVAVRSGIAQRVATWMRSSESSVRPLRTIEVAATSASVASEPAASSAQRAPLAPPRKAPPEAVDFGF